MKKENKILNNNGGKYNLNDNLQKILFLGKMASLGKLTAGIFHEVNNHLAITMSAMEELNALIEEYKLSINNKDVLPEDHLAIIRDLSKYLSLSVKAVNKCADIAKAVKSNIPNFKENILEIFNAKKIIIETLNLLEFKIKKKSCKIEKFIDDKITIYGNQKNFSQIVKNLVDNAIDACSNNGGSIAIRLFLNEQKEAELIIEDNGEGISPENIEKIFIPFFTTKTFEDSTGLGLNIVKEMIEHFNGQISVKSGSGLTVFTVKIPALKKDN